MIFLFTVSHPQKGINSFSFRQYSLEAGLDFINYLCIEPDDQLLSAHVIDEDGATSLPVAAFDGQSFSQPIHELAQVWQALLPKAKSGKRGIHRLYPKAAPLPRLPLAQESIDQLIEQLQSSQTRMDQQSQWLNQLDEFHQWAMIESLPSRAGLLVCYAHQIASLKEQIRQSRVYHAQLTYRLDDLLGLEHRY
ncbi:hypothetical protein [Spirosoma fluviale]|uniref:Uncharacterized protein n=1 Tax=Spirosoma fluviale TaxID=1597977 RepID=A0A286G5N0_9BACT|nr:hypothetical protein [Spirosoma fluviale]SOD90526.1 hypothetical protein SAMN06269250_3450 [Spirosoma fluviale]